MTLGEQLAILQAAKEGKKIKRKPHGEGYAAYVVDNLIHKFDFITGIYEIVPEPMEIWVNVYQDVVFAHTSKDSALYSQKPSVLRTVKFREVLDED